MNDQKKNEREKILDDAKACVCGHRKEDYGTPEDSFGVIAEYWNTYLGRRPGTKEAPNITAKDVSVMMALLKVARITTGTGTRDSFVDLAGYAACGGEIAQNETATPAASVEEASTPADIVAADTPSDVPHEDKNKGVLFAYKMRYIHKPDQVLDALRIDRDRAADLAIVVAVDKKAMESQNYDLPLDDRTAKLIRKNKYAFAVSINRRSGSYKLHFPANGIRETVKLSEFYANALQVFSMTRYKTDAPVFDAVVQMVKAQVLTGEIMVVNDTNATKVVFEGEQVPLGERMMRLMERFGEPVACHSTWSGYKGDHPASTPKTFTIMKRVVK